MFRESMRLLRKTGKNLILFEAGVQLVTFAVLVPFIGAVAEGAVHLAGLKYLTNENIVKLLKSVWTLPAAALIILIITAQTLLHFTGATVCFRASVSGHKLSFSELINELASSLKRMFAPGACTLVLHILLLMPAIFVPAAGGLLSVSGIPDVLTRIISDPKTLVLIYSGSVVASILLSLRWMTAIPVYVCRRCSFRAARRRSIRLISGRSLRVFAGFLAWSFAFFGAFALSVIFVTWAGIFCISRTVGYVSYGSEYIQIIRYCLLFVAFLFSAAAVPYLSAGMFVRYEKYLSGRKTVGVSKGKKTARKRKTRHLPAVLAAAALILVNGTYIYRLASGEAAVRFVLNVQPMVIAHRGASFAAPENTIYAFNAAIEAGADGIELDVQQTKDGVPVVVHDINLKRIAGINREVSSFTYDEISQLDVGSWFDEKYSDASIMKLEDVIELAGGKVFLNIELKRGALNRNIEQKTVDLIRKYGIENDCCVTSFSYESLKRIKRYDPDIKTGLIMSIATGDFYSLEAADAFSINSIFVNAGVVNNAHQQGKEVYAWTVNSPGEMRRVLGVNADHIITDRPELLFEQINRSITEDTLLDTAIRLIS